MFTDHFKTPNKKYNGLIFLNYTSNLIKSEDWISSTDLHDKILTKGKYIFKKYGKQAELVFVVLKVLKIIRVECARVLSGNPELEEQATNLLFAETEKQVVLREDLKDFVDEAVLELTNGIEDANKAMEEKAACKILNGDVVMIYGYSTLVFQLLQQAAQLGRQFSVIILAGRLSNGAIKMTEKLAELSVSVTLAPERASYTLMSRTNKIFFEAMSAFVDGAILCQSGVFRLCIDAKAHAVPVHMVMPSCRLSPLMSTSIEYAQLEECSNDDIRGFHSTDLIPAKFVNSIVTDLGSLGICELFKLAQDCFSSEDVRDLL